MAKILVIDDDVAILQLLEVHLQQCGHMVISAVNAKQGLNSLVSSQIDLILIDIYMPDTDGFEFMNVLFHKPPVGIDPKKFRIIAMSAGSIAMNSTSILKVASMFGAMDTIQKPLSIPELKKKIEDLLGNVPLPWGYPHTTSPGQQVTLV